MTTSELEPRHLSPATALSSQASDEERLQRALEFAVAQVLHGMAELGAGRMLTLATATQMWWSAVDAALEAAGWPEGSDEFEYLAPAIIEEDLGTDAFAATQDVIYADLTRSVYDRTTTLREDMQRALGVSEVAPLTSFAAEPESVTRDALLASGVPWGEKFGPAWRDRVKNRARTAYTGLSGYVALQAFRVARRETKTWVTRHDPRVRSTHSALDGVTIPLEQPFVSGPSNLMYPGDRSGAIGQTINCRCRMVSRR